MPYNSVQMINSTLSFDVLLPRGTLMSTTLHQSRIQCMLLSVIEAYDQFKNVVLGYSIFFSIRFPSDTFIPIISAHMTAISYFLH